MNRIRLWQQYRQQTLARSSLGIIIAVFLLALIGPILAPHDPLSMQADALLRAPSAEYLAGTDRFGRDVASRLIYGCRIALQVACLAVGFAAILGTILGMIAAFARSWLDQILSRLMDMMLAIPEVPLALCLIAVFGASRKNLILTIGIVYTPLFARIARSASLQIRAETYVTASRLLGANTAQLMRRHIIPNIAPYILVQISLSLAFAILAESTLSFLGFGVEPDQPSWGVMLKEGKDWLEQAWWLALFPGLLITIVSLAFHLCGDALRKALR